MIGYIYLIRNEVNGKGYVGQTSTSIPKRFRQHKIDARNGHDHLLYRAMRKYGIDNFTLHPIVSCESPEFLDELEKYYIQRFNTFSENGRGYNRTLGGLGSGGAKVSDATKAKMRAAKLGKKRGPFSAEHKARMAHAAIGNTNGRGHKGMVHSEETRAKIKAAKKLYFERKASADIIQN